MRKGEEGHERGEQETGEGERTRRTRDRGGRESQGQGDQYASTGTRRKLREGGLETIIEGRTGPGAILSRPPRRSSWGREAERRVERGEQETGEGERARDKETSMRVLGLDVS